MIAPESARADNGRGNRHALSPIPENRLLKYHAVLYKHTIYLRKYGDYT